ncbi:hypothetical protein ABZW95_33700, partial [Streptomyces sp. NPDC004579]
PISPMAPVSASAALPAGADTGGEQEGGQAPHPLAALFADANASFGPSGDSAPGTPANGHEVVDAELLGDLGSGADGDDSYEDGEDVIDAWEVDTSKGTGP